MVNDLGSTLAALADPTRFQVVGLLLTSELSAGELASKCSVSGPALSRHLRVLRKTGLVEVVQSHHRTDQDARLRVYRLRPEQFLSVKEWIEHMEKLWAGQLRAFKAYAEGKRNNNPKRKRTPKK